MPEPSPGTTTNQQLPAAAPARRTRPTRSESHSPPSRGSTARPGRAYSLSTHPEAPHSRTSVKKQQSFGTTRCHFCTTGPVSGKGWLIVSDTWLVRRPLRSPSLQLQLHFANKAFSKLAQAPSPITAPSHRAHRGSALAGHSGPWHSRSRRTQAPPELPGHPPNSDKFYVSWAPLWSQPTLGLSLPGSEARRAAGRSGVRGGDSPGEWLWTARAESQARR